MERGTFHDAAFVKALNDVCVPLVMPTSYKDYPSVDVKGEKRYKDYPRLTVEEAKEFTHSAGSAVDYKDYERWVTPVYVLANSKKELVIKTLDRKVINNNRIFQDIQAAQAKIGGTGTTQAVYRQFIKGFEAAKKASDADEWGRANKALTELERIKGLPASMKKELDAIRASLAEKGEEKLKATVENAAGDPAAAKKVLEELAGDFKGQPLEQKALDQIKLLK